MAEYYLSYFKLISDSGLLVLIWLVQLIIYPSFKYCSDLQLSKWHPIYTRRITFVVLPLMLSQLILTILLCFRLEWSFFSIIDLTLVLLTWILTFVIFVPLHQKIDERSSEKNDTYISKLVEYNWSRTLLWTAIFILTAKRLIL